MLLLAVGFTSCSQKFDYGQTGKVSGTLSCDGQPLAPGHAVVFMEPLKGFLAFGLTDEAGRFQVNSWNSGNLPVGTYQVQIAPPGENTPSKEDKDISFEQAGSKTDRSKPRYHKRYESHLTSQISKEVVAGSNDFKIEITSK